MIPANLRRVLALTALMFSLSLLPAQALGSAPRGTPQRAALSERFERWGAFAWSFLAGLFEKAGSRWDPSGLQAVSSDAGGR